MSDPSDDELVERVAALEETLEELRTELEPERGPFGLPRPPSPREVLRFTDEYAIPTAIAILEANVRTLELLRALLRTARGPPREDEVRERATSIGRTTVDRVDRALADLQAAIEDANLPRNAEARSVLEEAKGLNEEVRNALRQTEAERGDDTATEIGVEGSEGPDRGVDRIDEGEAGRLDSGGSEVEIDVDAELASIKDELDEDSGLPDSDDDEADDRSENGEDGDDGRTENGG